MTFKCWLGELFSVCRLSTSLKCDAAYCVPTPPPHHTGDFFHMRRHTALPFLSSRCKSKWALWNANLTHVANISERETSESRESSKTEARAWINTFIYQQFTHSQRLSVSVYTGGNCVLLYTLLHFLTGWSRKSLRCAVRNQRSKDSDMIRTVKCLFGGDLGADANVGCADVSLWRICAVLVSRISMYVTVGTFNNNMSKAETYQWL